MSFEQFGVDVNAGVAPGITTSYQNPYSFGSQGGSTGGGEQSALSQWLFQNNPMMFGNIPTVSGVGYQDAYSNFMAGLTKIGQRGSEAATQAGSLFQQSTTDIINQMVQQFQYGQQALAPFQQIGASSADLLYRMLGGSKPADTPKGINLTGMSPEEINTTMSAFAKSGVSPGFYIDPKRDNAALGFTTGAGGKNINQADVNAAITQGLSSISTAQIAKTNNMSVDQMNTFINDPKNANNQLANSIRSQLAQATASATSFGQQLAAKQSQVISSNSKSNNGDTWASFGAGSNLFDVNIGSNAPGSPGAAVTGGSPVVNGTTAFTQLMNTNPNAFANSSFSSLTGASNPGQYGQNLFNQFSGASNPTQYAQNSLQQLTGAPNSTALAQSQLQGLTGASSPQNLASGALQQFGGSPTAAGVSQNMLQQYTGAPNASAASAAMLNQATGFTPGAWNWNSAKGGYDINPQSQTPTDASQRMMQQFTGQSTPQGFAQSVLSPYNGGMTSNQQAQSLMQGLSGSSNGLDFGSNVLNQYGGAPTATGVANNMMNSFTGQSTPQGYSSSLLQGLTGSNNAGNYGNDLLSKFSGMPNANASDLTQSLMSKFTGTGSPQEYAQSILNPFTGGQTADQYAKGQFQDFTGTSSPQDFANSTLSSLINPTSGAINQFLNSPLLQSSMDSMIKYGQAGLQNSAAAKGALGSGATLAALQDYGMNTAGQYIIPQIGNLINQGLGQGTSLANNALNQQFGSANNMFNTGVTAATSAANQALGQEFGSFNNTLGQQYGAANNYLNQGVSSANTALGQQFGAANNALNQGVSSANNYLNTGANAATSLYGTNVGAAASMANNALNQQYGAANNLINQQYGYNTNLVNQQFGAGNNALNQQFGTLNNTLGQQFGSANNALNQQIGQQTNALNQQFGAANQGLASTLPLNSQFAGSLLNNGTSQYANQLAALQGLTGYGQTSAGQSNTGYQNLASLYGNQQNMNAGVQGNAILSSASALNNANMARYQLQQQMSGIPYYSGGLQPGGATGTDLGVMGGGLGAWALGALLL